MITKLKFDWDEAILNWRQFESMRLSDSLFECLCTCRQSD